MKNDCSNHFNRAALSSRNKTAYKQVPKLPIWCIKSHYVIFGSGALAELPRSLLRPLTTNSKGKYLSCSLRLSNNSLTDLVGLQYTINHFFAQPSKLGWLDLSFNKITCIEPVRIIFVLLIAHFQFSMSSSEISPLSLMYNYTHVLYTTFVLPVYLRNVYNLHLFPQNAINSDIFTS